MYMILFLLLALFLIFMPQMFVKNTYREYLKFNSQSGLTGAEVAREILDKHGLSQVGIEAIKGELSDHYDPSAKVLRLSEDNYYGKSISSISVAAHETGHALQDAYNYMPMRARAGVFPIASFGSSIGPLLMFGGLALRAFVGGEFGLLIAIIGFLAFAGAALFQIITLPVEFNASKRAVAELANGGYITGAQELDGSQKVLLAAALTYVAAALYSVIELVYWAWQLFGSNRD